MCCPVSVITSYSIHYTKLYELDCEWRWLDTSNLACQLGDKAAMHPATRYMVTVRPGITTEDGATPARADTAVGAGTADRS